MNPVSLKIFLHKHLELPLKMIVMEPMVLCITMFNSFAYGVSYLLVSHATRHLPEVKELRGLLGIVRCYTYYF